MKNYAHLEKQNEYRRSNLGNLPRTREGPYILSQLAHLTSLMGRKIAKVILLVPLVRATPTRQRRSRGHHQK